MNNSKKSEILIKIGLENHIRLNIKEKLFCRCINDTNAKNNVNTCHICLGFPGSLPLFNKNALYSVSDILNILRSKNVGKKTTKMSFDRKHYNYYDLPKGYQITQLENPVATSGQLTLSNGNIINIDRIAFEEDAGSSFNKNASNVQVNFNRSGTPLIEITTKPDFKSIDEVVEYVKILRMICVQLKIIDKQSANAIRCDVNVSLTVDKKNYSRTELKNLNSITDIKKSLSYEIGRQAQMIRKNVCFESETREWNGNKTILLRKKNDIKYLFLRERNILPFEYKIIPNHLFNLQENIISTYKQHKVEKSLFLRLWSLYLDIFINLNNEQILNQVFVIDYTAL